MSSSLGVAPAAASGPRARRAGPVAALRRAVSEQVVMLADVVLDFLLGIVTFSVAIVLGAVSLALLPVFALGLPLTGVTFAVTRGIAAMERGRARALLGVAVADPLPRPAGSWRARLGQDVRSGEQWRQYAYALLLMPLGVVGFILVFGAWGAGLAFVALPVQRAISGPLDSFLVPGTAAMWGWACLGLLLLLIAPGLTRGWAALDALLVRSLLGPSTNAELRARVATLTETRSAAVQAADAERRRIERDLHDGAQQRLVALAVTLGRARAKLESDPAAASALVAGAHEEAKAALSELRDLVRGLHPAVLEDRGLDAALSAVAARSPVPVRLEVRVAQRCAPTIEAVAYFVVTEALANVAKHARAAAAAVTVWRDGSVLHVRIEDDGVGGADPVRGTGLVGLAGRVAAADGTLRLTSPLGGPTVMEVDLPCGS